MKEPPGDIHSDGSFIVYERKMDEKTLKSAPKLSKIQKNQHDNSIKIIVLIWSE